MQIAVGACVGDLNMKSAKTIFYGMLLLVMPSVEAIAEPSCAAGGFVLNVGQAFASASNKGSAAAFMGAASRYADTRGIAMSALGQHRKKLTRAQEGEYLQLAQAFMGRFMAKYAGSFNVTGLKVSTCNGNIISTTASSGKKIIFRVAKGGGGYRVQDVNVSSVWLASQMRTTFVGVLNRNNGDIRALMKFLKG